MWLRDSAPAEFLIVVCDNGGTDETASVAVSGRDRRTRTRARLWCGLLKAIGALSQTTEIIGFVDGDGSDNLDDLGLYSPLLREEAALSSRLVPRRLRQALPSPTFPIGSPQAAQIPVRTADFYLGPFRAIRKSAYQRLKCKTATTVGPSKCRSKLHNTNSGMLSFRPTTHAEVVSLRSRVLYGARLEPALGYRPSLVRYRPRSLGYMTNPLSWLLGASSVLLGLGLHWVNNQPNGERGLSLVILSVVWCAGLFFLRTRLRKLDLSTIALAACILRLFGLWTEPFTSHDGLRYLADGAALLEGLNPLDTPYIEQPLEFRMVVFYKHQPILHLPSNRARTFRCSRRCRSTLCLVDLESPQSPCLHQPYPRAASTRGKRPRPEPALLLVCSTSVGYCRNNRGSAHRSLRDRSPHVLAL